MGINFGNVRKDLYLKSFYDENYLVEEANTYLNLNIYNIMLNKILDDKDKDNKEKIEEALTKINSNSKETKRFMKKLSKQMQKQSFAIQTVIDVQDAMIKTEQFNRALYRIIEISKIPYALDYYCKISFLDNLINNEYDHIPFIVLNDDEFQKTCLEFKQFYGINGRSVKNIKANVDVQDKDDNEFEKIFKRRLVNMTKRCKDMDYHLPKEDMYFDILNKSIVDGFNCFYCGQHMRIKGDKQQKGIMNFEDLFTFEHREPLSKKGVHSRDNVVIACMSCNTIKGDMSEDTFKTLLKELSSEMKYKMYEESSHRDFVINRKFSKIDKRLIEQTQLNIKLKRRVKDLEFDNKLLLDKS